MIVEKIWKSSGLVTITETCYWGTLLGFKCLCFSCFASICHDLYSNRQNLSYLKRFYLWPQVKEYQFHLTFWYWNLRKFLAFLLIRWEFQNLRSWENLGGRLLDLKIRGQSFMAEMINSSKVIPAIQPQFDEVCQRLRKNLKKISTNKSRNY